MDIYVNSENIAIEDNLSLYDLLAKLDKAEAKGIAVAINDKIITKKSWGDTLLNNNDKVLIIKASQGG